MKNLSYKSTLIYIFTILCGLLSWVNAAQQEVVDIVKQVNDPVAEWGWRYQRLHTHLDLTPCLQDIDLTTVGEEDQGALCGIRVHLLIKRDGLYYLLMMQRYKNVFEMYKVKKVKGDYVWSGDPVREFSCPVLYARLEAALLPRYPYVYSTVELLRVGSRSGYWVPTCLLEGSTMDEIDLLTTGDELFGTPTVAIQNAFLVQKDGNIYLLLKKMGNTFELYEARKDKENWVKKGKPLRTFRSEELNKVLESALIAAKTDARK